MLSLWTTGLIRQSEWVWKEECCKIVRRFPISRFLISAMELWNGGECERASIVTGSLLPSVMKPLFHDVAEEIPGGK